MRRSISACSVMMSIFLSGILLGGCGSSKREGQADTIAQAQRVGSESCTSTCHSTTKDVAGNVIAQVWANTTHTTEGGVQCEDCHGGGSMHWGIGPMPFPNPKEEQCGQARCHPSLLQPFKTTAHANSHQQGAPFGPDRFFFQGDAGGGQATNRLRGSSTDVPEVTPQGRPVTKGQHIEECSVCHNPNLRFITISGNSRPAWPFPNNFQGTSSQDNQTNNAPGTQNTVNAQDNSQTSLPNPSVSCAGCHDAHQPQQKVQIPQRTARVGYPIYRRYSTAELGVIQGTVFQPNGTAAGGTLSGKNNEVFPERVCAACHTVGRYKFSNVSTHQTNVYPQWLESGHANRNDPAWAEFSANPTSYINPSTGLPYSDVSHQTTYPVDMALRTFGPAASTNNNQGINNFACFKCHNGLTSIAWQENVQGTSSAPVVFGDAPATCITCHDPHANGAFSNNSSTRNNVRVPAVMTNYSTGNVKIFGNVFLDSKPVPSPSQAENAIICIFCHQGRESGFTLYRAKLAPDKNPAGSFLNPHYLGTAAMLWGANGYEFTGKTYSNNTAHQRENCTGCHMDNPTSDNLFGGHTWVPNVATCNTATCHGGGVGPAVQAEAGSSAPDVGSYRSSFDTNDYDGDGNSGEAIAVEIQHLQDRVIALLAANGIHYSDLKYPYFFSDAGFTAPFTAWATIPGGRQAYKAAFNLQFTIKGLPSAATSQTLVPNTSAAVHNYKYIIQLLRDSYDAYSPVAGTPGAPLAGVRPEGTRPATVYGPGQ